MFSYIEGSLASSSPHHATIDVQGVGYFLKIPLSTYAKLPKKGATIRLLTTLIIRDDAHELYGFLKSEEQELFALCRQVSGIGPKTALGIIGHMENDALRSAIIAKDTALLTRIPGIGKKSAERLALELSDKLSLSSQPIKTPTTTPIVDDATQALIQLGYRPKQAEEAIRKVLGSPSPPTSLSALITHTLRII